MSRAVLLSTCGDVFITSVLLKLWKDRWYNEVDKMYINLNNHCKVPPEVVGEFFKNFANDPKIILTYHPTGIGNGPPQVENLKLAKEDLILLLEDDFFIFKPGVVDSYFKQIEEGKADLLGSARYAYGEVADAAKTKYNLDFSGEGDKGFAWWPTGFYCKREDLLKTDLDFGSTKYPKGSYWKELDHTFENDDYTDTFTWASIQLRYLGLKSIDIPQYHASPFEVEEKEKRVLKWADNPGYIHGGSLSAGLNGYLSGQVPDVSNESAKLEIETRVAFWTICMVMTEGYSDFKEVYFNGIQNLVKNAQLDTQRIARKIELYKTLMQV